jgi:small-conductance mechanosensitive channel
MGVPAPPAAGSGLELGEPDGLIPAPAEVLDAEAVPLGAAPPDGVAHSERGGAASPSPADPEEDALVPGGRLHRPREVAGVAGPAEDGSAGDPAGGREGLEENAGVGHRRDEGPHRASAFRPTGENVTRTFRVGTTMFPLFGHSTIEAAAMNYLQEALRQLPAVLAGIGVFILATILASAARRGAQKSFKRAGADERGANAWGTIVKYVIWILGLVAGLAVGGVDLGAMMVALGAIGFALAFAMQDTIGNFIAGLILLTSHPFARGDRIAVDGTMGTVEEVGMRSTKIKTFDGLRVEVPNRAVLSSSMTILTHYPTRRVEAIVGVSYDDDIPGAIETAKEAMASVGDVLDTPEPEVLVDELGGSSVNLKLRFWVSVEEGRASWLQTRTEAIRTVKEELEAAGYDIPFPIRTVFLHEESEPETVEAEV